MQNPLDYTRMAQGNLEKLYRERASALGVAEPIIPRTKERLISVLRATDMLGNARSNPNDPVRQMAIQMFTEKTPERKTRLKSY